MKIKLALVLVLLSFVIATYLYPSLPDEIPTHWNANGEVDDYSSKSSIFWMPVLSLILVLIFMVLPYIDPLKKNYKSFRKYYDEFVLLLIAFMLYIFALTIASVYNYVFNMTIMLIPAFGILFLFIGYILKRTKRNWFFGIRTPWTLSSDKVWKKTHELGGKLFQLTGIITFVGLFFGKYAILFLILPAIIASLIVVIYSYMIYEK